MVYCGVHDLCFGFGICEDRVSWVSGVSAPRLSCVVSGVNKTFKTKKYLGEGPSSRQVTQDRRHLRGP